MSVDWEAKARALWQVIAGRVRIGADEGEEGGDAKGRAILMDELNPGIRKLVAWLNANGWPTCDSGDGKTHDHACDREYAYVVVQLPSYRTENLVAESCELMRAIGVESKGRVQVGSCGRAVTGAHIEALYSPWDGYAHICINNIDDAMMWPEGQ